MRDDGPHSPGPTPDAIRFLIHERNIRGFGTETVGTDAGQGSHYTPPYPAHFYLHGAGKFGLQCLANLDLLPPRGAILLAAPLKIKDGTGSPLRVMALVQGNDI
jgi:kynurenine formamidase